MSKNLSNNIESVETASTSEETRRKLKPVNETFNLDNGDYIGIITEAFFFTEEQIMIKIELSDNMVFLVVTTADRIERYPFSQILSQANVEYVEDLEGLKVSFTIKNNTADSGDVYSNIKKITLAE